MKAQIILFFIAFSSIVGAQTSTIPAYLDEDQPLDIRIEDALKRMTLEEKVAMLHAQSKFSSPGCPRLGIPEIWMSDGPHGVREEIGWDTWKAAGWTNDSCTAFPALTCLAATFNEELAYQYGKALGKEARYRKKDIILGPGVNIYRTPLNGRNFEYMGEDPLLASKLSIPYINGVQENGVATCVKHFALNNQEKWRNHINVVLSERALHEIYLPAFKASVIEGKAWSLMGSYNKFNQQYCCHNDSLLNKILRDSWKFDGVVVSDWGGTHDTYEAALNGLDIEMGTGTDGLTWSKENAYDNYYLALPLLHEIQQGKIAESVVDEKVRRILRLIFRTTMNRERPFGSFATPEHAEVARKVGEEGTVLLKNEKNFLPIAKDKYNKIAVIGENATRKMTMGGGSSELKVKREISPLQGLQEMYGEDKIIHAMGYASGAPSYSRVLPPKYNLDSLKQAAIEVAREADVVLFIGGLNKNARQDCENSDRETYDLPFGQNELIEEIIKVNPNTAIILITGNAVAMPWIKKTPAVLQSWYLGSESGYALANIISGEKNVSGKLPFTIPVKLEDNGAHHFGTLSYPGDSINQVYEEDILVGYRWHDTKKIAPLFPFGHGLSYTTFECGKAKTSKKEYGKGETITLELSVKNTGNLKGAEVVQLYVSQKKPSVYRPAKELKAFKKVFLEPGETKNVTLTIPVEQLGFYDETSHHWKVEVDKFILHYGTSSGDLKGNVSVQIMEEFLY